MKVCILWDRSSFSSVESKITEATTRGVLLKKVFLKVLQNSQENTCARVSATLVKKRLWHRCFPVNFEIFLKNTFFTEHLWKTTSKSS